MENCVVTGNKGNGVIGTDPLTFSHCTISENLGTGITTEAGARVEECTISANGSHGLNFQRQGTVSRCLVTKNLASGMNVKGRGNRIDGNTFIENGQDGIAGVNAVQNLAVRNFSGANTNFQYRMPGTTGQLPADANIVGPVVTGAGTSNPWANFSP